ncbi:MAG: hypothetical protein AB1472_03310, partial [Candidatus Omnitrophota bacterium]
MVPNTIKSNHRQGIDIFALFLPDIKELLAKKDFAMLKDIVRKINSMDMAEGWKSLGNQERLLIFKLLGPIKAVEVFEELDFQ